jgi:hypothetical protein
MRTTRLLLQDIEAMLVEAFDHIADGLGVAAKGLGNGRGMVFSR